MSENILDIKVGKLAPVKSPAQVRDEFEELIAAYKVSNPVKYARKEPALLVKLAKLEKACGKKTEEQTEEPVEEPAEKVKKVKAKVGKK